MEQVEIFYVDSNPKKKKKKKIVFKNKKNNKKIGEYGDCDVMVNLIFNSN
jgi:hypothetical protein